MYDLLLNGNYFSGEKLKINYYFIDDDDDVDDI